MFSEAKIYSLDNFNLRGPLSIPCPDMSPRITSLSESVLFRDFCGASSTTKCSSSESSSLTSGFGRLVAARGFVLYG